MIARARAIAHGNAYTTYATLKKDAQFVCCENMAGDMTEAVTEDDLEFIWTQFKYAGENYIGRGKEVTRNLVAMEVSPAKEESRDWTLDDWNQFAHRFIEEMDKVEFRNKAGKVSSRKTDFAHSKWLAMLHTDAKSGIPHLHFMASRFTTDGRLNDTNLIGLKATMAANSINRSMGWRQSKDISAEHKAEIKDALYDILRGMERFDWDVFAREVECRGYGISLRRDNNNNKVVGYRIERGNSRYNASEIGRQLTAGRIEATWGMLHQEAEMEAKTAKAERFHFVCEPTRRETGMVRYESDIDGNGKLAEPGHYVFDISERLDDTLREEFHALSNDFDFQIENVLGAALLMYFGIMLAPDVQPSDIGGGGNNDLPHKRKDDDDEMDRARNIARFIGHRCPRKAAAPRLRR